MTTPPAGRPLVLLKLGGALLTHKHRRESLRRAVVRRLAEEIAGWCARSDTDLVLAHGSGSFGHVAVRESGFAQRPADPVAAARVAASARRLNQHVVAALLDVGLAPVAVPGSVLATCWNGAVATFRADIVRDMLAARWLPVLYGDVAPDALRGAAIAGTEPLLVALARASAPARLVLATDVDGVFEMDPHTNRHARPLAEVTPHALAEIASGLGGARPGATDVTGGMYAKVALMLGLLAQQPGLEVRIVSGLRPGAVPAALDGLSTAGGTRLAADGAEAPNGLSSAGASGRQ